MPIEPCQIIPFDPAYQLEVRAIAEQILCHEYQAQDDLSQDEDLYDIAESYAAPHSCFLLALVDSRIVATGGVLRISDTDCELRRLYVRSGYRRQGFASSLMARLVPFIRQQGYKRILLELRPELREKVDVYARYGFQPVTDPDSMPRPEVEFLAIQL